MHWTMTIQKRATGWIDDAFHQNFRELMLHAAAREELFCPAYCLMPDHLHLIWMGLHLETDQLNGIKFLREYLNKLLATRSCRRQSVVTSSNDLTMDSTPGLQRGTTKRISTPEANT